MTIMYSSIFDQTIGWNLTSDHVQCHVFGEMAKLANPIRMEANVSDLFHDAEWVMEHIGNQQLDFHFFYGCRPTGTSVSKRLEDVRENRDVYRFIVSKRNESKRGAHDYRFNLKISRLEDT